jgi:hypothetical protein
MLPCRSVRHLGIPFRPGVAGMEVIMVIMRRLVLGAPYWGLLARRLGGCIVGVGLGIGVGVGLGLGLGLEVGTVLRGGVLILI